MNDQQLKMVELFNKFLDGLAEANIEVVACILDCPKKDVSKVKIILAPGNEQGKTLRAISAISEVASSK